jgi:hypothetical protein
MCHQKVKSFNLLFQLYSLTLVMIYVLFDFIFYSFSSLYSLTQPIFPSSHSSQLGRRFKKFISNAKFVQLFFFSALSFSLSSLIFQPNAFVLFPSLIGRIQMLGASLIINLISVFPRSKGGGVKGKEMFLLLFFRSRLSLFFHS